MIRKSTMAATIQAVLLATAAAASAASPADVCAALKLRASGDFANRQFNCHARAMLNGTDVDQQCLDDAAARFQRLMDVIGSRPGCPGSDVDGVMLDIEAVTKATADSFVNR